MVRLAVSSALHRPTTQKRGSKNMHPVSSFRLSYKTKRSDRVEFGVPIQSLHTIYRGVGGNESALFCSPLKGYHTAGYYFGSPSALPLFLPRSSFESRVPTNGVLLSMHEPALLFKSSLPYSSNC